jgi:hypothetical protein
MGGRHITDHKSWVGGASKGSVFPEGVKTKDESSAEGFGALLHYEDTTDTIKSQQEMAKKKVHGHPHKTGYRH